MPIPEIESLLPSRGFNRRDHDGGIPLATFDQMKTALASASAAAQRSQSHDVDPDAPHAFHADDGPSYRKDAVEGAWNRFLTRFAANGAA